MTPADFRKQLRNARKSLSAEQQQQHSAQAFLHFRNLIEKHPDFLSSKNIALFLSQDGELNTSECIDYLWQQNKHKVFLPVLETKDEWHMAFVHYTPDSEMQDNRFEIPEPVAPMAQHLPGEQIDLVLMPLVGFDRNGNRLGMGGGYYDRTFAFKLSNPGDTTKLIGWAHSCQQAKQLPFEEWDVPLDGVITEDGLLDFNQS